MNAKHSAGPWELTRWPEDDDEPRFRISAESTLHLDIHACADGYVPGQNEANALLIAAAPCLLAFALEFVENFTEDGKRHEDTEHSIKELVEMARLVIVKATGQEPTP